MPSAALPDLTASDVAYLAIQARAELARRHLSDYARLISPDTYEQPPHVLRLIELLEAIERREVHRAIVTMPPRSSKSTHVSRLFPSWWIGRHPEEGVILASYGDLLATGNGRAVRDMLAHPDYPFSVKLRADLKAAGQWATDKGGGLLAGGVGTGLTGFGGALLVADDLIKGREEAESEIVREHTWNWHEEVFMTRLKRGGAVLETGTRWHEDDPIGRILNSPTQGEWYHLNLPHAAEPGDVLGRPVGELLPIYGEVPPNLSSYAYSALYQQRPTPAGGGVFKAEWMQRRYTADSLAQTIQREPRFMCVMSIDTGGKPGIGHDPSSIAVWGTDGLSCYLLDSWAGQEEYADVKAKIVAKWWEWRPRIAFIEDATHAAPIISDMRRGTGVNIAAVKPEGSKWVRADAVTPLFQSGRIVLPAGAPWLDAWLHEHLAFPNGQHDDRVDTTSLALSELVKIASSQPANLTSLVNRKDEREGERIMREIKSQASQPKKPEPAGVRRGRG